MTINLGDEKSLSDHLKLPLQRINDYQLILQDLIDIQRILKEETTDLEKALDLLLSIPQKISDKKFLSNIEGFGGNIFHLGRLLRHVSTPTKVNLYINRHKSNFYPDIQNSFKFDSERNKNLSFFLSPMHHHFLKCLL